MLWRHYFTEFTKASKSQISETTDVVGRVQNSTCQARGNRGLFHKRTKAAFWRLSLNRRKQCLPHPLLSYCNVPPGRHSAVGHAQPRSTLTSKSIPDPIHKHNQHVLSADLSFLKETQMAGKPRTLRLCSV